MSAEGKKRTSMKAYRSGQPARERELWRMLKTALNEQARRLDLYSDLPQI